MISFPETLTLDEKPFHCLPLVARAWKWNVCLLETRNHYLGPAVTSGFWFHRKADLHSTPCQLLTQEYVTEGSGEPWAVVTVSRPEGMSFGKIEKLRMKSLTLEMHSWTSLYKRCLHLASSCSESHLETIPCH
jgi:hypothetical protein